MTGTPHTSAPNGKRVTIILRSGKVIKGKFEKRTGVAVFVDGMKIPKKDIRAFFITRMTPGAV